jgi:hypothetical protein
MRFDPACPTGGSRPQTRRPRRGWPAALLGASLAAHGCGDPTAWGEANSLIVIAPTELWTQVEQQTYDVLEPTIYTTRDEKRFEVTQIDPSDPDLSTLRRFRNVIVFATPGDALLGEAASAAGMSLTGPIGRLAFQAADVWARGQTVTAVPLAPGREVETWIEALPSVLAAIDASYREWVLRRMFVTPADTALASELRRRFGFELLAPEVYDFVVRPRGDGDTLVIIRNDNPDPSELIRSVLIERGAPLPELTAEAALEWRAGIDSVQYNVAQAIDVSRSGVTRFQIDGRDALEVTGVWSDERGDFPAGGPFLVWLVDCPGRTYRIDAWLYAPNQPKYEYIIQIQQILGSFRCTSTG